MRKYSHIREVLLSALNSVCTRLCWFLLSGAARALSFYNFDNPDIISIEKEAVQNNTTGKETVLGALARIEKDIANNEKLYSTQRLTVVTAELQSIQQEIQEFEATTTQLTNNDSYAKTMHQMFLSLDIYRRPMLAAENEDFIANINRKEMRRIELEWLQRREKELLNEKNLLHARLLKLRSSYQSLQQLLSCILSDDPRPDNDLQSKLDRAQVLRDSLAAVSVKLHAAVEYAQAALRCLDVALPAWKLATVGKSGSERTSACADACSWLVRARCSERGARRVLVAHAAPRASRTLRLALDYAFSDAMHDHKYQNATEIFLQFKGALIQLVNSIHQVLLNNIEHLEVVEKNLMQYRNQLRAARVNAIVKKGLAELTYEPAILNNLKKQNKTLQQT